jgi:hypothetical protein
MFYGTGNYWVIQEIVQINQGCFPFSKEKRRNKTGKSRYFYPVFEQ